MAKGLCNHIGRSKQDAISRYEAAEQAGLLAALLLDSCITPLVKVFFNKMPHVNEV